MKIGKWFLLFAGSLCFLGGVIVLERNFMEKKTYGYYKETAYGGIQKEHTMAAAGSGKDGKVLAEGMEHIGQQCWLAGQITNMEVLAEQVQETGQGEKRVFLTFDDGPSDVTESILKLLDEKEIKATFFLIGEQITDEKEQLVQRMSEEGHEIGIHTYTHERDQIYASAQAYIDDVVKTADRIEQVTGKKPVYYRFPWGSVNCYICSFREEIIEELASMGYQYIDWNVSGEDSVGTPSIQSIYANVKKDYNKFKEPVVLMHDSSANGLTAETLPDIITLFQDAGYQFGAIGERSCPYQWCKK